MKEKSINIKIESSLSITLTIVFFILKKCNVIDWPWIWVFSPLWISILLVIAILLIIAIVMFIRYIIGWIISLF